LTSLWPWGSLDNRFFFTFSEPYFQENFPDFGNDTLRFFFKYTNDNNPFQAATTTPLTVVGGLAVIGGYFALFGVLKMFLFMYNKKSFEKSLQKRYSKLVEKANQGQPVAPEVFNKKMEPDDVDEDLIKETLSYEMMMTLAIFYNHMILKEREREQEQLLAPSMTPSDPLHSPKLESNRNSVRRNTRGGIASAPGSYQDDDFKTSKDYGAGNLDQNYDTEIERLSPIPEGAERLGSQRSHKSI
jgi:hypothetical protein